MEFKSFNEKIQLRFNKLQETGKLFRSTVTGDQLWKLYLESFPPEYNNVFRDPNSSENNCNICHSFIRRYGNIVAVDSDNKVITMFDVEVDGEYHNSAKAVSELLKTAPIGEVFFETFQTLNSMNYSSVKKTDKLFQLGLATNVKRYTKEEAEKYGVVKADQIVKFNHFHIFLKKDFIIFEDKSVETIMGGYRDAKNVFKRGLDEISIDTLKLVRDLIIQRSLLDGEPHRVKVEQMIKFKEVYDNLSKNEKDSWSWVNSYKLPYAKFKNELIGVLCSDLAEGMELNKACETWNKRVDPVNYKKAVAPITKKQIEDAKKFVEQNGYTESFDRRLATINDIKISEIIHSNVGDDKVKSVSIFDNVKATSTRHKKSEFDGIEEVTVEKFMKDILPTCTSIEAYLQGKHSGNMVTMTTSNNEDSKPIFNWSNNYSWTYNGNLAGKSFIKEAVKSAGGKVDGVLRFSITWNDSDGKDGSDLDAWCRQPNGEKIGYSTGFRKDSGNNFSSMKGQLDLDIRYPDGRLAVENIYFTDIKSLKDGKFDFWVNQYSSNNSQGFKAEIEFDGEIYSYEYNNPLRTGSNVPVASVTLNKGKFTIEHTLQPVGSTSIDIYGLPTNEFHKVNLVCLSPNHWGDNKTGNKHYFFMLDKCKTDKTIRGFHAENLIPELYQHRATLEVLGNTTMIEPTDKQLSGLGFNSTVSDELIVKLQGTFKRLIKIKF